VAVIELQLELVAVIVEEQFEQRPLVVLCLLTKFWSDSHHKEQRFCHFEELIEMALSQWNYC
jgi:hypothetical protein